MSTENLCLRCSLPVPTEMAVHVSEEKCINLLQQRLIELEDENEAAIEALRQCRLVFSALDRKDLHDLAPNRKQLKERIEDKNE